MNIQNYVTRADLQRFTTAKIKKEKYHRKKVYVDGIMFDSAKEAGRYCELKLMEKAGQISNLERQKKCSYSDSKDRRKNCRKSLYVYSRFLLYAKRKLYRGRLQRYEDRGI